MSLAPQNQPDTLIGQRANPHPSGDPEYEVEVIEEDEHGVVVQYLNGGLSWWITRNGWNAWAALSPRHGNTT